MARIQIFRDPVTSLPSWAVIHDASPDMEARADEIDPIHSLMANLAGDGPRVLVSTAEHPIEVIG